MQTSLPPAARVAEPAREEFDALAARKAALREHRVYGALSTPSDLRTFAEHHVVCVLDFMSLLKSLQVELTTARSPWTPPSDPEAARLVNEIVVDEETDVRADGRVQSHFEWYVEAMEELDADTGPVRALVAELRAGAALGPALERSRLPAAARAFGLATARALEWPLHVRAAVFLHGREDVIPGLFLPIVRRLQAEGLSCEALIGYLERHIEVDGGDHGPRARALLARLFASDATRATEAASGAAEALAARGALWDAIASRLESRRA